MRVSVTRGLRAKPPKERSICLQTFLARRLCIFNQVEPSPSYVSFRNSLWFLRYPSNVGSQFHCGFSFSVA